MTTVALVHFLDLFKVNQDFGGAYAKKYMHQLRILRNGKVHRVQGFDKRFESYAMEKIFKHKC